MSSNESSGDSGAEDKKTEQKSTGSKKPSAKPPLKKETKKRLASSDEDVQKDSDSDKKDEDFVNSEDNEGDSDYAPAKKSAGKVAAPPKGKGAQKKGKPGAKKRKGDSDDEGEAEDMMELGSKRFVNVNEFKGKTYVNIREYYQDNNGDLKPGKKGISLSADQFHKLVSFIPKIEKKLDE